MRLEQLGLQTLHLRLARLLTFGNCFVTWRQKHNLLHLRPRVVAQLNTDLCELITLQPTDQLARLMMANVFTSACMLHAFQQPHTPNPASNVLRELVCGKRLTMIMTYYDASGCCGCCCYSSRYYDDHYYYFCYYYSS